MNLSDLLKIHLVAENLGFMKILLRNASIIQMLIGFKNIFCTGKCIELIEQSVILYDT